MRHELPGGIGGRDDASLDAGVVNLERDHYRLGEWVRRGPAMAAFTVEAHETDGTSPADRLRRRLELSVVVRHAVEVAGPAFSANGVAWVYPRGHSCRTGIYAGAVEPVHLAGFLERVAEQVGEVAGSGSIAGTMSAYANADAIYLVRSVRC